MGHADPLPDRFPNGTRYVVEGRNGRIHLRYLEFPDGRHIELPADLAPPETTHAVRRPQRKRRA
ncbi:MAG TPA: hypothetical protein VGI22_14645 [Xanthobacteraceae bacterium]|jgi:hypothetical protein